MPLPDLIALGLAFVGLIGVLYAARLLLTAWATTDWPTVEGQILEAEVAEELDAEGTWMYRPPVRHAYSVAGRQLNGTTIFIGDSGSASWRWPAQRLVTRYVPGKRCQVSYDPRYPSNAVLEPGVH